MENLLTNTWKKSIRQWLDQDTPNYDVGGYVVGCDTSVCNIYCKSNGVLAGLPFVNYIFEILSCDIIWLHQEGSFIEASNETKDRVVVASVSGPTNKILLGERLALNILSRCSGIATKMYLTRMSVQSWKGKIAATRKTTPGFGIIEKYGVLIGGGTTHRMDLSQMVMLKDNHLWAFKNKKLLKDIIKKAKQVVPHTMKIEVEVRNEEEAVEAAKHGADVIMLDNFSPNDLKNTAYNLKSKYPNVIIEASGGITIDNIALYAHENIDVISQGSLTYNYDIVDFSLKIKKE